MCKIAESVDSLDLTLAGIVWHDLKKVFDEEIEQQSKLFAKVSTIWQMLAMSYVTVMRHMRGMSYVQMSLVYCSSFCSNPT